MARGIIRGIKHGNVHGSRHSSLILGSYAPVGTGPGLVVVAGSSNPQGIGVAANMTDFPGIGSAFASFQLIRNSALSGPSPTIVTETIQDLQSRTTSVGVSYGTGTMGAEGKLGRDLDAANNNAWGGVTFTADGSFLDASAANGWLNPSYPTVAPSWMERFFSAIDAAVIAHGKPFRVLIWDHGNDGNIAAGANYYNNLVTFFDRVRSRYGDVGIVIPILTNKNVSGGLMPTVRTGMEAFAMRFDSLRVRVVYLDDVSLRDAAHYADDAGGVLGYCEAGRRYALAVISAANNTISNTFPLWGAQGDFVTATSLGLPPTPLPPVFGTYNNKSDIGVLWYSGASANAISAPAGWTQVTNSPQFGGAVADSRLHVFTRTLQPGDSAPTIADVASDEAKASGIFVIRNSTGLDVNPTGDTVAAASPASAVTWPGLTTVSNNCLIVQLVAYRIDDVVTKCSGYANAALGGAGFGETGPRERVDFDSNVGSGYGIAVCVGTKAAAGAIGNTTATLASACSQARLTLAFKP